MQFLIVIRSILLVRWCACMYKERSLEFTEEIETNQLGIPHSLDLSTPDETMVIVSDYKMNGIRHREYVPMHKIHIESVFESGTLVWSSNENERCTFAIFAQGTYGLILIYTSKDGILEPRHFKRNGEEWKTTTEDDFEDKLEEMEQEIRAPSDSEGLGSRLLSLENEWAFCPQ
ncbi:hypothetical protein BEWA_025440 [Theileria equi strain WA]|uniref:Signal peptide-containing protein n=1 Tax=Theileria equi strain WA TaxID=1537102 RepID=L0AVW8_THEEQ|nr:hypothetical protein BEWA_025440 [Theileria equi strain WA]AFZ79695.1 hypothetical protein BEWA_025440 [Theileria equi strain WA]|eukprot:XP_004829361.1 hypothetical protein BEWA_025440 [Theileria equi strain WA]